MESRGPPIEPIGPPLLPTSPYNGNVRPPTWAADNTPIAARIVRPDAWRVPPMADRFALTVGPAPASRPSGFERSSAGSPPTSRGPLRASGESLSLRQPSRVEGGEFDQGHFRSARRSRDDGRRGRDRSAGRGHVVAGRRPCRRRARV